MFLHVYRGEHQLDLDPDLRRRTGAAASTLRGVSFVVAEAGFSECVGAGMDCMSGFGAILFQLVLLVLLVMLWIGLAAYVTVTVTNSKLGWRRSVVAIVSAWVIPVVGVGVFFAVRRRG